MDKRLLEYWANLIEGTLYAHKIQARVQGGTIYPRWIRYQLFLGAGHKPEDIKRLESALAMRLQVDRVRVAQSDGRLFVEVPHLEPVPVPLYALCKSLKQAPRQSAVLGLSERGVPLLLRLPSPDASHALIAGTTGSGKTVLARSMALSLAMLNRQGEIQLAVIDPKGYDYAGLSQLPHLLRPVVSELEDAAWFLSVLVDEMLARDRERVTEPRIVLFIDELADLIEAGGPEVLGAVTRLTQRGRSAGIHVVACTQKPTAAAIGSLVKSNFPVRLVGSVGSPEDAKVAAGLSGTGAERLLGSGDFLLVVKGRVICFQAAYADARTVRGVVARLATEKRATRTWVTETPLRETPPLIGERPQAASRWVPKVVVDNRGDRVEQDARKVLNVPGWTETWIESGKLRYGSQSEVGRIVGVDNAGGGRRHILAVEAKMLEIYANSTSTTSTELSDSAKSAKTRVL